jgi:hypothetical protein
MRRYYGKSGNTCSIKLLKNAYIGVGIRMTSDKNTAPFVNVPMTNMKILDYDERGFSINHPSMPKAFWVDFDQLPLTRLKIDNGVISDEITFVENIVNHKMQLIRTLDTEYIDLIFAEKELEKKADKIIPISEAVPGEIYIGAQCEEGNEMIFMGTWYTKDVKEERLYWSNTDRSKSYLSKLSPQRAFFAVPNSELSYKESEELENKYKASYSDRPDDYYWDRPGVAERKKEFDERVKQCDKAKKNYITDNPIRFKILNFPITSKRIKKLIVQGKNNTIFSDKDANFLAIFTKKSPDYVVVVENWETDYSYLADSKNNIDEKAREYLIKKFGYKLEPKFYEER